jgi:hypothetical protein
MGIEVEGLDDIAFAVSDHALSVRWYRELLGLERSHPEWGDTPDMLADLLPPSTGCRADASDR